MIKEKSHMQHPCKGYIFGDDRAERETCLFLRRFDSFSVREKSGIKLAEEELGVSAEWVLDPVLCAIRKAGML